MGYPMVTPDGQNHAVSTEADDATMDELMRRAKATETIVDQLMADWAVVLDEHKEARERYAKKQRVNKENHHG
jgi:hypothetical protein